MSAISLHLKATIFHSAVSYLHVPSCEPWHQTSCDTSFGYRSGVLGDCWPRYFRCVCVHTSWILAVGRCLSKVTAAGGCSAIDEATDHVEKSMLRVVNSREQGGVQGCRTFSISTLMCCYAILKKWKLIRRFISYLCTICVLLISSSDI